MGDKRKKTIKWRFSDEAEGPFAKIEGSELRLSNLAEKSLDEFLEETYTTNLREAHQVEFQGPAGETMPSWLTLYPESLEVFQEEQAEVASYPMLATTGTVQPQTSEDVSKQIEESTKKVLQAVAIEHMKTRKHLERQLKLALSQLATKDEIVTLLERRNYLFLDVKNIAIPLIYFFISSAIVLSCAMSLIMSLLKNKSFPFSVNASLFGLIFGIVLLYTSFYHIKDNLIRKE